MLQEEATMEGASSVSTSLLAFLGFGVAVAIGFGVMIILEHYCGVPRYDNWEINNVISFLYLSYSSCCANNFVL